MIFNFFLIMIGFVSGAVLCIGWMRWHGKLPQSEELERYRRSQMFSNIGLWDLSFKTNILHWSDEIYEMFGYKPGEVTPSYELFCDAVHPEDRERVKEAENACIERKDSQDIEYRVIWPDGTIRWLRETGDVLFGEDGEAVKFTGTVRDVTDNRREIDRIRQLAHFDVLTGLPNRVLFKICLEEAIGRAIRHKTMIALIYMDLNKFKPVNDNYGHEIGDKVLKAIAERLTHTIRSVDTVARVGGDEFIAILEDIKAEAEVNVVVEKLRRIFHEPFTVDGNQHDVSVSIGVSRFPQDSSDIEELINIADQAMYQAKKLGA
jgi:diguanylate cyclase (GGDEF)-like protein/PAS domain S-box-containing protein